MSDSDSDTQGRKCQQLLSDSADDILHKLFWAINVLCLQVIVLKEVFNNIFKVFASHSIFSAKKFVTALDDMICELKYETDLSYHSSSQKTTKLKEFICLAENCNHSYMKLDDFHRHIWSLSEIDHMILQQIINQRNCHLCNKKFNNFRWHDNTFHEESSNLWLNEFLIFFEWILCKFKIIFDDILRYLILSNSITFWE